MLRSWEGARNNVQQKVTRGCMPNPRKQEMKGSPGTPGKRLQVNERGSNVWGLYSAR